ncbi:MAG: agmatine deiminase family protein [Phycisphaerae bacterium]|nr:agmatine deiminase family protein [Phycisphaerae bacterium]
MMRNLVAVITILMVSTWCSAQTPTGAADDARVRIGDQEPTSLPKYMTPEEQLLPPLPVERGGRPPSGDIHCSAEYEPCEGIFFAWEGYTGLLSDMTVTITTHDEETMVYMVVDSASEQSSAYSTLNSAGADMDQVEFIVRITDTVWIRDYGPRFIFEDGNRAIIDHTYNRPRPNDNMLNDYVATLWSEPEYDIPLTHGGGNFHLFANGDAFMTDLILDENPGQSEQDVKDLYEEYQGVDLTIYPGFPTWFDSTQHIDMWMLPLGDDKIIIGEYDSSTGQPYTITENATTDLIASGYTVYRTPGWQSGGTHYTYTNAIILNDLAFVSTFGHANDAVALATFQAALPGYTFYQFDCSGIIHSAGAMHCISMHVPAYTATMRVTPGGGLESEGPIGGPFTPDSIIYTLENTSDLPINYSVTKTVPWLTITNGSGSIGAHSSVPVTVAINAAANSLGIGTYNDTVDIVNLTDHSGDTTRAVTLAVGTPQPIYSYPLDSNPGWTTAGEWAFGQPTGQGGTSYGYPDPASGATGSNVYGVNLNGDYSTAIGGPWHVTLGPVDLSNVTEVELRFQRWLNTDYTPYAYATVEVSTNGSSWQQLWQNPGGGDLTDSSWQAITLLAPVADNEATVWFRWGYQIDSGAYAYSGWNIDDVEIWGLASPSVCPGDSNCDAAIGWRDIDYFVAAMNDNVAAWEDMFAPGTPSCSFDNNDVNGDGTVNWRDIDPLVALMNTTCP